LSKQSKVPQISPTFQLPGWAEGGLRVDVWFYPILFDSFFGPGSEGIGRTKKRCPNFADDVATATATSKMEKDFHLRYMQHASVVMR